MNSQDNDRQPDGGQDLEEHQQNQDMPEDPQDWQDLGPFDEQEQHGSLPGRQGPRAKPQPQ